MIADASGNTSTCDHVITVIDTTDPVITLAGANPYYLCDGSAYVEPGMTVTDNCDPAPMWVMTDDGGLDTETVGCYTLTYEATDICGNTATITREVCVKPLPMLQIGSGRLLCRSYDQYSR